MRRTGPTLDGRLVRTSHEVSPAVEITKDMAPFVQGEEVCGVSREFTDEGSWPFSGREGQADDAIMPELADIVEAGSLNVSAHELTERRRTRRAVWHRATQQMQAGCLRLTRNEQPVSFARHTNFEQQDAIVGLRDFLNPALKEHGGNFPKHKLKFSGAQCHAAAVSFGRGRETCRRGRITRVWIWIVAQSDPREIGWSSGRCSTSRETRTIHRGWRA